MNKDYNFGEDVRLVIGDEKQPVFYPRMKIKRWDNEVNFSVGLISKHQGSDKHINDRVEWTDEHGTKAMFYEKDDKQFEFEVELSHKPKSNVLHLSIETKGLNFYYQPELTESDINNGCERPDNVVGSYAVYHKTMQGNYIKGNNYRAGKFCHIYRPYATDSNGWEVWCDLNIEDDMQITIPQDFINDAVYPIVVDPTFGVNPASPGGSWYETYTDGMYGSIFTSPNDIISAQSLTAYCREYDGADAKGVIVLESNLNIMTNGVGNAVTISGAGSWFESTFSTDPTPATSTDYVLMFIFEGVGPEGGEEMAYDSGTADQEYIDYTNSYTSPTNPTDAEHKYQDYEFSIYCTYTGTAPTGGSPAGKALNGSLWGPFAGPII